MTEQGARVLLHASDLHFGRAHDPEAAQAFLVALAEAAPDLIVLSGDFTQRAKVREYRAARAFLRSLPPVPVVVTPGNHDVPLYRFWERILAPLRNYRRHIARELDTLTRVEGMTVVALNSASPYGGIVNGRLLHRQLRFATGAFREAPRGDFRVLVTHHNLIRAPDAGPSKVLPRAERCLRVFGEAGVDLILGGHAHRGWVGTSREAHPEGNLNRPIVLAYSGTTTSKRGRISETGANSFNRIRVTAHEVEITRFVRARGEDVFVPVATHRFPRHPGGGP